MYNCNGNCANCHCKEEKVSLPQELLEKLRANIGKKLKNNRLNLVAEILGWCREPIEGDLCYFAIYEDGQVVMIPTDFDENSEYTLI